MDQNNQPNSPVIQKGKIPPQAIDLEKVILGSVLTNSNAMDIVVSVFREEDVFYQKAHSLIYKSCLDLYKDSEPIDLLSISQKLRNNGDLEAVGGDHYLVKISQLVSSSAHTEFHCRIVLQQFVKRRAIKAGVEMMSMAYDEEIDIFDVLDNCYSQINDVTEIVSRKAAEDFPSAVDSFLEPEERDAGGVPSGLSDLQQKLNGYQGPDLIILAARPGMGKTALVLSEALSQAMKGIPVGIFSLEMSTKQLIARLLANYAKINIEHLLFRDKLTNEEALRLVECKAEFKKLPIYILDQASLSPLELKIQLNRWIKDHGVRICYVDYLQLMSAGGKSSGNREAEISSISRNLKAIAKEFNIPVVALSQLSRNVETRGGSKRPLLSDLRESGAIEQDADIVMFIYRPEYYNLTEWDDGDRGSCKNQSEIIISKFRNGTVGRCRVRNRLWYMEFSDINSFVGDYVNKNAEDVQEVVEDVKPSKQQSDEVFYPADPFDNEGDDDLPF